MIIERIPKVFGFRPRGGRAFLTDPFVCGIALGMALVIFIIVVVVPRPYTLFENDVENSYFYNAKIWTDGFITVGEAHPGMPARIAFLLFLKLSGSDTGPTFQRALNVSYCFVGLLYVLGAAIAHRLLTTTMPSAASAVGITAGLTLPASLYFLGYFGADSFLVPVILPLVAIAWLILDPKRPARRWELLVAGGLAGAALSVKLSSVPLVAAVGIGITVAMTTRAKRDAISPVGGFFRAGWFWASTAAVHLILCIPLHSALYRTWFRTVVRRETRVSNFDLGAWGRELWTGASALWIADPLFVIVVVGVATVWILRLFTPCKRLGTGRLAFLLALAGAIVIGLRVSGWQGRLWTNIELAFPLRNSLPVLLGTVPVIAAGVQWIIERPRAETNRARLQVGAWILLLILCTTAVGIHFNLRWKCVTWHDWRGVSARERFEALRPNGKRIAFWDGSPGDFFGDASFRLWGNYRWYRCAAYDVETLENFPTYTLFHLRNVDHVLNVKRNSEDGLGSPTPGPTTRLGTINGSRSRRLLKKIHRNTFKVWFPLWNTPRYGLTGQQLFTEDPKDPVTVGLVVWPRSEERYELSAPRNDLLVLLRERMGAVECWEEEIEGVQWVIARSLDDG